MKNCFVKELNGVVNDDNYPIYNAVRFNFFSGVSDEINRTMPFQTTDSIEFESTKPVSIYYFYSGNPAYENVQSGTLAANVYKVKFPNENGRFVLKNKSAIGEFPALTGASYTIANYKVKVDDLQYTPLLGTYLPRCCYDNELYFTHLEQIERINVTLQDGTDFSNISKVNIDSLAGKTGLTTLDLERNIKVYGNIESVSDSIGLFRIKALNCTNLTGDLKVMLDTLFQNGKTSGTIQIEPRNTGITYNGEALTEEKVRELNGNTSAWVLNATFTNSGYTFS